MSKSNEPTEAGDKLLKLMYAGFKPVIYRNENKTMYIRLNPPEDFRHGEFQKGDSEVVMGLVERNLIVVDKDQEDTHDENGMFIGGWTRYRLA